MTTGAASWVWANSRAKGSSLIVLLAIAFEFDDTWNCVMSIAELAAKSRLSNRAVPDAIADLVRLNEVKVRQGAGSRGRNGYDLFLPDDVRSYAESAHLGRLGMQILHSEVGKSRTPSDTRHAESAQVQNGHLPGQPASYAESAQQAISDDLKGSVVSGKRSKPSKASEPRPDVDRLCEHLADRIEANGSRRPVIGQRWKDAARLLIDNDGRTEEQVHACIDWCQQHHFWHRQIMSMEKLRAQYDRLRLEVKAEREKAASRPANGHQPTHEEFNALRQNWARPLDDQEAGNDPRGNDQPHRIHGNHLPAAEDRPGISGRLV